MTPAPLISLDRVSRHYRSGDTVVRALDEVSLDIHDGEFVAIMGQSGSGKSTLMNILGCLDRPTGGAYRVRGRPVAELDADGLAELRRETFGFVFQRYNLLATASAEENVEIPAIYAGMPRQARQERAAQLLGRLGLGDRRDHRPAELSGGQQQRVAIARALMNDPPVILADEPTGALDTTSGEEVMALLARLHGEGRTIILITHDEQVAAHAERIVRISDGRIVSDSRPAGRAATAVEAVQRKAVGGLTSQAFESAKTALRALSVNMFRTALTLLGIVIGVGAVITMLAVGDGSKQKVLDRITAMGTNLLSIRPGAPGVRSSGDVATMSLADAEAILELPHVELVVPERSGRMTVRVGGLDTATSVQGVGAAFPLARDWPLAKGAFFTNRDVASYTPVAVLGRTVADALFPGDPDPIGNYILASNMPFQVIGVLAPKGAASWGGDQDDVVFVPVTTGMTRLFGRPYLSGITVKVGNLDDIEATETAITDLLRARHGKEDFQRPQHGLAPRDRHRDAEHAYRPARLRRGDLAPGRRHRHHEHHAGERDRAHPRDRHPHGDRRAHARHPSPVQYRGRSGRRARRHSRCRSRIPGRLGRGAVRRDRRVLRCARRLGICLRGCDRPRLRLRAGPQSGDAGPHHGSQYRIGAGSCI